MVHPDEKVVLPFAPEPILKEAGAVKNDCERNAAKRGLTRLRREHPHLKAIIIEDGLASNAPHIRLLQALDFRFILGARPKGHSYLFEFVNAVNTEEKQERRKDSRGKKEVLRRYRWVNNVPLNDANDDLKVNFLEYWELSLTGKVQQHFSWVTDLTLDSNNVEKIMRGGRARWKIENETFNTLKNKGYQFEHNFGHGYKNLSTVMASLMFLAFLIDQVQESACQSFQRAFKKMKRKCRLWNKLRNLFYVCLLRSWQDVYDGHVVTILCPNTS
jgi:hypothetical protein